LGALAGAGPLREMREFAVLVWVWVLPGGPAAALDRLRTRTRRIQPIAGDRYVIELAPEGRPEELLRELTAEGAALISLNPLRETLEDVFVRRVAEMGDGARGAAASGARAR
jgi:hypothetical protein